MDHPPFDVDALARIANGLFRDGAPPAPGPSEIPSAVQAAAPGIDQGLDAHAPQGFGMPAGGATFSPAASPTRPAFGRPVSTEVPVIGYGLGQPATGKAPTFPHGFDPQALLGFAPIPSVEDGFADIGRLVSASQGSAFQVAAPPPGVPAPSFGDIPSAAQAFPGIGPGIDGAGLNPYAPSAGGAIFSPSASPSRPAFGRAVPFDVPFAGTGMDQPGAPGLPRQPSDFDPRDLTGQAVPGAELFSQPNPFDLSALEKALSPSLAPIDLPGHAAAPSAPRADANPSTVNPSHVSPGLPAATTSPGTRTRTIDRPTPNAFQFTDAPHLGEFAEEAILRAALDPRNGAPSIEGLKDRTAPLPDPYEGQLAPSAAPSFYFIDDRMDYFADDVPKVPRPSSMPFNAEIVRRDFPVLHQKVNGHPLVWLDNGATTQKPQAVIDRISRFYETDYSNISRSGHELANRATQAYEDARKSVQRFINASAVDEIVFVRGTTEGINLVAQSFGRRFIKEGDEILLTHGEHHANIVPWYNLAKEVGAHLKVVPFDDNGEIMLDEYEQLLNHRVKIVATTHVANAIGTVLPVKAMSEMAHRQGIPVLVDGAQSISHMPIDVQDIDCDFYVFSGHKVYAPSGIGALYGKKALLDQMPPWQGGGNMIKDVTFERVTFQPPPLRFEAGTGNIADAIGMGEAIKYLERFGMENIEAYEHVLLDYAIAKLAPIKGLAIIGKARQKAGVVSFLLDGKEPTEVGKALNEKGIAVRAGHHCALPILRRYGVEATVRPAFAMYNTFEDADRLADAVREIAAN